MKTTRTPSAGPGTGDTQRAGPSPAQHPGAGRDEITDLGGRAGRAGMRTNYPVWAKDSFPQEVGHSLKI